MSAAQAPARARDPGGATTGAGASAPAATQATARSGAIPAWAGTLLVVALWLLVRPYRGVRHDSILYLGQILGRMFPDSIGRDLFLAYGSQDRFSIFSGLMQPLIERFGVPGPLIGVLLASEVLFLAACWMLVRPLADRRLQWGALVALAAVSHTYGGLGAFSFAEPFLTARALAEPFALFGLVALLQGRIGAALALEVVAALFHPLIALPALVAGWLYLVRGDRRWVWALAVLGVALAAGLAGVAPFDAAWKRYDPAWWEGVHYANRNAFVASQVVLDWVPLGWDVGLLWLARGGLAPGLRRLVDASLLGAAVCTLLWGLGADLLHDVLLTQLQLWRSYWLPHLLAVLLLPLVLRELWRGGPAGRWVFWAVVLAGIAATGNFATGWLCLLWAGLAVAVWRGQVPVAPGLLRLAAGISLVAALVVTFVVARHTLEAVANSPDRFHGVGTAQVLAGLTLVSAALGWMVLAALARGGAARLAGVAAAFGLLAWGGVNWDQRSDWQRYVEDGLARPAAERPFAAQLAPGASVYWNQSLLDSWMLLQRPAFLAVEQSAGLLFNRGTSLEYMRRHNAFAILDGQREVCMTVAALMATDGQPPDPGQCEPPVELIRDVCRVPHGPDFMIFAQDDPAHALARWTYPARGGAPAKTFSLYDCAALRRAAPPAPAPAPATPSKTPARPAQAAPASGPVP